MGTTAAFLAAEEVVLPRWPPPAILQSLNLADCLGAREVVRLATRDRQVAALRVAYAAEFVAVVDLGMTAVQKGKGLAAEMAAS